MAIFKRKHRKTFWLFFFLVLFPDQPSQAQTTPPLIESVVPQGGQRGQTVSILLDGINLANASQLVFTDSGLKASIVKNQQLPNRRSRPSEEVSKIEDPTTKNRLTVTISIAPDVEFGIYGFRVVTPLGISNVVSFAVGSFAEVDESQINNDADRAQRILLPTTVRGEISEAGDVDHFAFEAKASQELVFAIVASPLGSLLKARLILQDRGGKILAQNAESNKKDPVLTYRFEKDGVYVISVSDGLAGGGDFHFYRLHVGEFSFVTGVFPLGVQAGKRTSLQVRGANLAQARGKEVSLEVSTEKASVRKPVPITVPLALNKVRIAVGSDPEEIEREPNNTAATAEVVSWPVTINGRIFSSAGKRSQASADEDCFRFSARKGQRLVLEVEAERLGSDLDSVVEILDLEGNPVTRTILRSLASVNIAFDSRLDSQNPGAMVGPYPLNGIAINDYLIVEDEVVQLADLPGHPDDFTRFKSSLGFRTSFFDTTAAHHPGGTAMYKVEAFPPGTEFSPNGLPIFQLNYRNDDGDPMYGSDSRLDFVAPADASYIARIRDLRGGEGDNFAYRLTIREPRPDYILLLGTFLVAGQFEQRQANPQYFSVPVGGQIPISVVAYRIDGFDGEIEVSLENLPDGLTARPGIIPSGADSTVLLVRASKEFPPVPLQIMGRAKADGQPVIRGVDTEAQLSLLAPSTPPDLRVIVNSERVEIAPGKEVEFTVRVHREKGFQGRIRLDLRDLPQGIRLLRVGIAGIVLQEEQDQQTLVLYAEPWARPLRQPFYVVGRPLEDDLVAARGKSFVWFEHSSDPVELVVAPQRAADHR